MLDFFLICTSHFFFQVTLYAKAHRALQVLDFFSVNEWRFSSENSVKLANKMSIQDRSEFYFDVNEIDWPSYLDTFVLGVRHFLIKDSPDSIPEARKRSKRYELWAFVLFCFFTSATAIC